RLTLALVLVVLVVRVVFGRPVLDSLLFAVAVAVGLMPELLPMITTVTLSRGALRMAARKVIVKRLASIHDLGAMSVLCTDKTGTLTSAQITLARSLDPEGAEDARASRLGAIAATVRGRPRPIACTRSPAMGCGPLPSRPARRAGRPATSKPPTRPSLSSRGYAPSPIRRSRPRRRQLRDSRPPALGSRSCRATIRWS